MASGSEDVQGAKSQNQLHPYTYSKVSKEIQIKFYLKIKIAWMLDA